MHEWLQYHRFYILKLILVLQTCHNLWENNTTTAPLYQYEVYELNRLKSQRNSKIWIAIAFGTVDFLIVGGIVLYVVKKYKLAKKQTDAEVAKTEAETKLAEEQAKQTNRTCAYCGASVPDGDDCCPACGSRSFKEK